MGKLQISDEARDKIEDATLAAFMEQYGIALDAGIDGLIEECADDEFPSGLDKRLKDLIEKECTKERKKAHLKTFRKLIRSAAAVLVLLLCACSVLFMSVEAFRVPIINIFAENTNKYWEFSANPDYQYNVNTFNPEDPLEGIVPGDLSLVSLDGAWDERCLSALYSDNEKTSVLFSVFPSTGTTQIDTEDATAEIIDVMGYDATLSSEEDRIRIGWFEENNSCVFLLYTQNFTKSAAIDMVELIIQQMES